MSTERTRGFTVRAAAPVLFAALVVSAVAAIQGCEPAPPNPATPGPVTLGKPADNSYCIVCHKDFEAELIAAKHVEVGVGCTTCHGESLAHGDDEFNITTPDVRYGRAEIDSFCKTCHKTQEKGEHYQAFLKKWQDRRRPNGRMISKESVCTDCHGNHAVLTPDKILEATTPR